MTNTEKLEAIINESGYKKSYLAKAIGVRTETFGRKLRNQSSFNGEEMIVLCDLLGITDLEEKERIFFAR